MSHAHLGQWDYCTCLPQGGLHQWLFICPVQGRNTYIEPLSSFFAFSQRLKARCRIIWWVLPLLLPYDLQRINSVGLSESCETSNTDHEDRIL